VGGGSAEFNVAEPGRPRRAAAAFGA